MDERFAELARRIGEIEKRNARVEKDKAWETSFTRIFVVALLTYFVAVLAFWMLGNRQYFLNALVPTVGFVLSVQSIPFVKRRWMRKMSSKK